MTCYPSDTKNRSKGPCDVFDPWVSLGEGSGWDLRIRPAAVVSGNLGTWTSENLEIWEFGDLGAWKSRKMEIWGPGNPEIGGPKNQKHQNSQNSNLFFPKCRQGLD